MKKNSFEYFYNELKDSENPTEYFDQYIHDDSQPENLILAIVQLLKEGILNTDNFSHKSRSCILEFHEKAIEFEDKIFLMNNNIVPLWKFDLDENLLNKCSDEIKEEYCRQYIDFISKNNIKVNDLEKYILILNKKGESTFFDKNQNDYLFNNISKDFFVENYNELYALKDIFVEQLDENDLKKLINNPDLLYYKDEDELSLEFMKEFVSIHYPNEPEDFNTELANIHEKDPAWVNNFLKKIPFKEENNYELLDEHFGDHEEIFKQSSDTLYDYYDNNIDKLSEDNIRKMMKYSEQISLNIISNLERDFSSDLIKEAFFNLDKYFIYGVNRLDFEKIDFKELVYKKIFEKLKNKEIEYFQLEIDFVNVDLDLMLSLRNNELSLKLLNGIEDEEDFIKIYNSIENNNPSNMEKITAVKNGLENKIIKKPIKFILERNLELDTFEEDVFDNYSELSSDEIKMFFNNSEFKYKIIYTYHNYLNDKKFIIKNIKHFKRNDLSYLVSYDIIDIEDLKEINIESVNTILLAKGLLDIEEFIYRRKVEDTQVNNLIEELKSKDLLDKNLKLIIKYYNTDEALESIFGDYLYFESEDFQEKLAKQIFELKKDSQTLFYILKHLDYLGLTFLKDNRILEREHLRYLSDRDIPLEYFIGRIDYISRKIKLQEDSRGVHFFLENGEKLITYSTYKKKYNKTDLNFTEKDLAVFNFLISDIVTMPKNVKVRITRELDYEVLNTNIEINITNLEEMKKWFDFYEVDSLEVSAVRVKKEYVVDFGVGKDKKEQTLDFLKEVRKLDLSQLDTILQDKELFNNKRGYGVEAEFSIMCDYSYQDQGEWEDLNLKELKEYIVNNYPDFEEFNNIQNEGGLNKFTDENELRDELCHYMSDYDMRDYNLDEEFNYMSENFTDMIKKFDKKRKGTARYGYYSSDGDTWDLKTDSSVEDEERGMLGIEIASPILYGKKDLNIFKKVIKDFTRGYEVEVYNAGVHVHHDVRDYLDKFNTMDKIARELYPMQEMLFNLIGRDEHSIHSYCQKYELQDLEYGYSNSKDMSINFKNNETIEFRLKEGTEDVEDISNWVVLTHHITDTIIKNLMKKSKKNIEKKKNLFDRIILASQAVYKRGIVDDNQIETLLEMYNSAKEFQNQII